MKNKISRNYEEELSFAVVDKNLLEGKSLPVYTIFHLKKNPFKGIENEVLIKDLEYKVFARYIKGACFSKLDTEMVLYNGFSKKLKKSFYPETSIFPLNDSEMKNLKEYMDLPKHIVIKKAK